MKINIIKILIWLLFIGTVFFLALIDLEAYVSSDFAEQDAIRHVMAFAFFIVLSKVTFPGLSILKLILITVLAGLLIEFAQKLFTGGERKFQWQDILYNLYGTAAGVILLLLYKYITLRLSGNRKEKSYDKQ